MTETTGPDPVTTARSIITELFTRHQITDPSQARRLIRERFTQTEVEQYRAALKVLDGMGGIG